MIEEQATFDVRAVIVCDDVRKEDNGKHILIGVYNDIVVPSFPAVLTFAFWVQVLPSGPGAIPIRLRLRGEHDERFFEVGVTVNVGKPELSAFSFGGITVALQIAGKLSLEMQQHNKDWQLIRELMISKPDATGASKH